jgi:hypothetical protein
MGASRFRTSTYVVRELISSHSEFYGNFFPFGVFYLVGSCFGRICHNFPGPELQVGSQGKWL